MELKKQAILILALTALVLVFYFRMSSFSPITIIDPHENAPISDVVQSIAKNTVSRHFDKSGKLNYSFYAEEVVHLSPSNNDDTPMDASYTQFASPTIAFYEAKENWKVTAEKGRVSGEEKNILLHGNVTLEQLTQAKDSKESIVNPSQASPSDTVTARLLTETLLIQPQSKVAQTESPVTISYGSSSLSATGMTLDIEKQKLKLHAKVRGSHAPL